MSYLLVGYRTTADEDTDALFTAGLFGTAGAAAAVMPAAIGAHPHLACWRIEEEPAAEGDEGEAED